MGFALLPTRTSNARIPQQATVDVSAFLGFTPEDLKKRGIPRDILQALRTGIRQAFPKNFIPAFIQSNIDKTIRNLEKLSVGQKNWDTIKSNGLSLSTKSVLTVLIFELIPIIEAVSDLQQPEHEYLRLIPSHISHLLISVLSEEIEHGEGLFVSDLPLADYHHIHSSPQSSIQVKGVACVRYQDRWHARHHFEKHYDHHPFCEYEVLRLPRALCIRDASLRCLTSPAITVDARYAEIIDPKIHALVNVSYQFRPFDGESSNCIEFYGELGREGNVFVDKPPIEQMAIYGEDDLRKMQVFAKCFVENIREHLLHELENNPVRFSQFTLPIPTSNRDWDYIENRFLLQLAKDENVHLLQRYIDETGFILEGDLEEDLEMTPKQAVVAILRALPSPTPQPSTHEKEKRSSPNMEKLRQLERHREAELRREAARSEPKKQDDEKLEKAGLPKQVTSASKQVVLTEEEAAFAEDIFNGNAKKSDAFIKFAMKVLQDNGMSSSHQTGSHIHAHATGKESATVVKIHRGSRHKDTMGSLPQQKRFLKSVLGLEPTSASSQQQRLEPAQGG